MLLLIKNKFSTLFIIMGLW